MAAEAAFLLATHFFDSSVDRVYRSIRKDSGGSCDPFLLITESFVEDFRREHEFAAEVFRFNESRALEAGHLFSEKLRPRRISPNHGLPFALIHFHMERPGYRHYWLCEYDVRFSGSWSTILDHFADNDADLLGTTLTRFHDRPEWSKWAGLKAPDEDLRPEEMVRGFFPFCRLSAPALEVLARAYRTGWEGHYECSVPTILSRNGMTLEDFGGDGEYVAAGNRNRFYTNTPQNGGLAPGTFVFRPAREAAGDRPDTLWHPVKAEGHGDLWEADGPTLLDRLAFWR